MPEENMEMLTWRF